MTCTCSYKFLKIMKQDFVQLDDITKVQNDVRSPGFSVVSLRILSLK